MTDVEKFLSASDSAFSDAEAQSVKQENQGQNWQSHLVDMVKLEEVPAFRLTFEGVSVCPSGSLSVISGGAKQGKSQFLTVAAAVMMSGKSFGCMKRGVAPQKILWADTEQSVYDIQTNLGRLYTFAGIPAGTPTADVGLHVLGLRPCSPDERREIIADAINDLNPDVVIIDGARDLLNDFNDVRESNEVVQYILSLSAALPQTNFFVVIHTNDGTSKLRGHLGTELMNKCADRFTITKDPHGFFKVEHISRHQTISRPFYFKIDFDGHLTPLDGTEFGLIEEPDTTLAEIFEDAPDGLTYKEIEKRFADKQGCSAKDAKNALTAYFEQKKIVKKGTKWNLQK